MRRLMIQDRGLLWSVLVRVLRRSVSVTMLGRWRNRVEGERLVRPDEQDTARRVVRFRAELARQRPTGFDPGAPTWTTWCCSKVNTPVFDENTMGPKDHANG